MEGFWPIFFLAVVLEIPVAGLLYLVWWAIHQTPEIEEAPPRADDHQFRRWRRQRRAVRAIRAAAPTRPTRSQLPECPPGGRFRVLTPPVPARAATAHARGSAEPVRQAV